MSRMEVPGLFQTHSATGAGVFPRALITRRVMTNANAERGIPTTRGSTNPMVPSDRYFTPKIALQTPIMLDVVRSMKNAQNDQETAPTAMLTCAALLSGFLENSP